MRNTGGKHTFGNGWVWASWLWSKLRNWGARGCRVHCYCPSAVGWLALMRISEVLASVQITSWASSHKSRGYKWDLSWYQQATLLQGWEFQWIVAEIIFMHVRCAHPLIQCPEKWIKDYPYSLFSFITHILTNGSWGRNCITECELIYSIFSPILYLIF